MENYIRKPIIDLAMPDDIIANGFQELILKMKSLDCQRRFLSEVEITGWVYIATDSYDPPDLVFMDINIPFFKGEETFRIIRKKCPAVKFLIYSSETHDTRLLPLLSAPGVYDCLDKKILPAQLEKQLNLIHCTPNDDVTGYRKRMWAHYRLKPKPEITESERQFLRLSVKGLSLMDVGEAMSLKRSEVNGLKDSLTDKIGSFDRAEMLLAAVRIGLVEL